MLYTLAQVQRFSPPPHTGPDVRNVQPRKQRHIVRNIAATVLLIIAAVIIFLPLIVSSQPFRNYVSNKVSRASGREFSMAGPMRLHWGFPPLVEAQGVMLGNVTWGTTAHMLDVSDAAVVIDLTSVLFGPRVKLTRIALSKPVVVLEKSPVGQANWTFKKQDEVPGQPPSAEAQEGKGPVEIGQLVVADGKLTYRDPKVKTDVSVDVSTGLDDQGQSTVRFNGSGKFKGMAANINGTGGSVLSIHDDSQPYPIDGKVSIGKTTAQLKGSVKGIMKFSETHLTLDLKGDSLADLFPILGITLPPTPPYHLTGELIRSGTVWTFNGFHGKVGDSDLSGDFSVDTGGKRPMIRAKTLSKLLDIDDLGGFVGKEPQTGTGETASPTQKKEAKKEQDSGRVLPTEEWKLDRLRAVDADFELEGLAIRGIKNPLDNVKLHLKLEDGLVTLDPLDFGVAGGKIKSKVTMNAKEAVIKTSADLKFHRLHLHEFFPDNKMLSEGFGIVGGRAKLEGTGNSPAALLGSANGDMGFVSAHGLLSNLLLEIASLNGGEIMKLLFAGDEQVELRCAVAQFQVHDGEMKPDFLIVDTDSTVITGEGKIDLKNEKLDLEISPEPKSPGVLSARSEIKITGSFQHPSVLPDPAHLLIRGGAAALLGFLNPAAALIAFIEPGTGEDQPCAELIRTVKHRSQVNDADAPPIEPEPAKSTN